MLRIIFSYSNGEDVYDNYKDETDIESFLDNYDWKKRANSFAEKYDLMPIDLMTVTAEVHEKRVVKELYHGNVKQQPPASLEITAG